MDCLLAFCIYIEAAVGYGVDRDIQDYIDANPSVAAVAEQAMDRRHTGSVALGADKQWGRFTAFAEIRHESDITTEKDVGREDLLIGGRLRF